MARRSLARGCDLGQGWLSNAMDHVAQPRLVEEESHQQVNSMYPGIPPSRVLPSIPTYNSAPQKPPVRVAQLLDERDLENEWPQTIPDS